MDETSFKNHTLNVIQLNTYKNVVTLNVSHDRYRPRYGRAWFP